MTLPELRAQLRDALTGAGIPAVDREPPRPSPPVALIGPGAPYLDEGDSFGTRTVRLRVRLVVASGDSALVELDELIEDALPAIEEAAAGDDWRVIDVSEPYTLLAGTVGFPAVDVTVTTSAVI